MDVTADLDMLFADSAATMAVGADTHFPVIFSAAGQEVPLFDGGVMTTDPHAVAKAADVATNGIDNGTVVTINDPDMGIVNAAYTVATVKPDGVGLSTITLTKA